MGNHRKPRLGRKAALKEPQKVILNENNVFVILNLNLGLHMKDFTESKCIFNILATLSGFE